MGLRIFGGAVAVALAAFAVGRYRKGQLRRGELLVVAAVCAALSIAAVSPNLFDPLLSALGFRPGQERRIIGLLVISNVFTLALLFRGFSRDDLISDEVGELVDSLALSRLHDAGWDPVPGACAVVIPAHDEAATLPAVLTRLPHSIDGLPILPIVVCDGCTDATEATARNLGATVVRRDLRRGSGAAVRLGYRAALEAGARIVVTIDADGQHDPAEMPRLVAPLLEGRADMVQGSRVLGASEPGSRARGLGIRVFARVLTTLGRTKITDPSTGYRAMTADAVRRLDLRQDQFYVSEIILDAARKGFRVVEAPVTIAARAAGTTKKPPTLRYAWGFSKAMVRTWLR